jgi:hypothetical protein
VIKYEKKSSSQLRRVTLLASTGSGIRTTLAARAAGGC